MTRCLNDIGCVFVQLKRRCKVSDLSSVMAIAIGATCLTREQDILRLYVSVGDQSFLVEILQTFGDLGEDKASDSLTH